MGRILILHHEHVIIEHRKYLVGSSMSADCHARRGPYLAYADGCHEHEYPDIPINAFTRAMGWNGIGFPSKAARRR